MVLPCMLRVCSGCRDVKCGGRLDRAVIGDAVPRLLLLNMLTKRSYSFFILRLITHLYAKRVFDPATLLFDVEFRLPRMKPCRSR